MLVLSRRADDSIVFPGLGITVHLLRLSSKVVRVGIEAPPQVRVLRKELADGSVEETFDIETFLSSAAQDRDHLHELRNQLNCINLGLQFYRQQVDAGMIEQAARTLDKVILQLGKMEQSMGQRISDQEQADADAAVEARAHLDDRAIRILLVEDDSSQRDLLAGILSMKGFDVVTAANGNEAVDHVSQHGAPDFVLMDMRMPQGDGPTTIRHLRRICNDRSMKIVATSGSEPREVGLNDEFDRWFAKPINTDGLVKFIQASFENAAVSTN